MREEVFEKVVFVFFLLRNGAKVEAALSGSVPCIKFNVLLLNRESEICKVGFPPLMDKWKEEKRLT